MEDFLNCELVDNLGNYLLIHLSVQKTFRFVGSPGDPTNLVVFVVTK